MHAPKELSAAELESVLSILNSAYWAKYEPKADMDYEVVLSFGETGQKIYGCTSLLEEPLYGASSDEALYDSFWKVTLYDLENNRYTVVYGAKANFIILVDESLYD